MQSLKEFKEIILRPAVNVIPFEFLKRIGPYGPIILYYHLVSDYEVTHISHLYKYKGTREFKEDMDFLLREYSPTNLRALIGWIRGENSLPKDAFLLTFDDGLREVYDIIVPILLNKGIPATIFIPSESLNNKKMCYLHKASLCAGKIRKGVSQAVEQGLRKVLSEIGSSFTPLYESVLNIHYRHREYLDKIANILNIDYEEYLNEKQPYLTAEQITKLIDWGFTIGAHSLDHPYYSTLSLDEQLTQTYASVREIRQEFGLDYGVFAFPHNDFGVQEKFFEEIQKSSLIDVTFGTGGISEPMHSFHLQRVSLEKPILPAERILKWQYARWAYRRLVGR